MGFGRALGQQILGEQLARERRGLRGQGCGWAATLAGHIAGRIVAAFDGEQRLAIRPVEKKDEALLGGLGDGVDFFAIAIDRQQNGWRGKIAIPKIVLHSLKVPDSLAGLGVQAQAACWRRGRRRCGRHRRNRMPPSRWEHRRCRGRHRRSCRPSCWRRRWYFHASFGQVS